MARPVARSLAGIIGGAALLVTPIAFALPAQATGVVADHIENENDPAFYEEMLEEEGFENVDCTKTADGAKLGMSFTVPELTGDRMYVLAVVKAGSDGDDGRIIDRSVKAGDVLTHTDKEISYVILCSADEEEDEETPPTTKPTMKPGPVVETDRPDQGPSALPLVAGGSLVLLGLGTLVADRRRRGTHR